MTADEMYEDLRALIEAGHGDRRVLLTDMDPQGHGFVYEPDEVGLLLGDDDRAWIGIDLRLADTREG
jgi:cellulose biosynthesis protein BcsQ